MKSNYKSIGNLIQESTLKNKDSLISNVQGININKEFMLSVGNIIGTDLSRYKKLEKNQFACNLMHVGRDKKIVIALKDNETPSIVSPAYKVFKIKDTKMILPEYLMMFFRRNNFDRFCWFKTDNSVRGSLSWKNFCETKINIPHTLMQKRIVNIYNYFNYIIKLKKQINQNLDLILNLLFENWFINYNHFNSNECESSLNNHVPSDWEIKKIGELPIIVTDYVANGSFASLKENVTICDTPEYAYFIRNTDLKSHNFEKYVNEHSYEFLKKSKLFGDEVIISNVGDVGSVFLCPELDKPMTLGNNMIMIKSSKDLNLNYYMYLLFISPLGKHLIDSISGGSVQSKFNKTDFRSLNIVMPPKEIIQQFNELITPIFDLKKKLTKENMNLENIRDILLPQLMEGKIDVSNIKV